VRAGAPLLEFVGRGLAAQSAVDDVVASFDQAPDDVDALEAALDEEEEDVPIPPPLPVRRTPTPTDPGARLPRTQRPLVPTSTGTSSWLNAPREGFTQRQEARAAALSAPREAARVTGLPRERTP